MNHNRQPIASATADETRVRHGAGHNIHTHSGSRNSSRSWRNPDSTPNSNEAADSRRRSRWREEMNVRARMVLSGASSMYGMATSP